jgi:hypothetical protein
MWTPDVGAADRRPRWSVAAHRGGVAAAVALLSCAVLSSSALPSQDSPSDRETVTLEAIQITPAAPSTASLCHLLVTIANHGTHPASRFRFVVKINGRSVDAYADALYLQPVAPGRSADFRLYNFWSTETLRAPQPTMQVEVALVRGSWVKSEVVSGVTTWSATDSITGLPSTKRVAIPLKVKSQ